MIESYIENTSSDEASAAINKRKSDLKNGKKIATSKKVNGRRNLNKPKRWRSTYTKAKSSPPVESEKYPESKGISLTSKPQQKDYPSTHNGTSEFVLETIKRKGKNSFQLVYFAVGK